MKTQKKTHSGRSDHGKTWYEQQKKWYIKSSLWNFHWKELIPWGKISTIKIWKWEIILLCWIECMCLCSVWMLNRVQLFATPWTVAHLAPLSMGFSKQEYWNRLPFPSRGSLPKPGIKPVSPVSSGGFFTMEPAGNPWSHFWNKFLLNSFVIIHWRL